MIEVYVNDIKCSLENKCYFSALALALALPDICGMAEHPNKQVAERYIEWYDTYLGAYLAEQGKEKGKVVSPWLSGEIVYNLRNTYLHQGNPSIASDKVKEEINQLDKFILMLGDGTVLQSVSFNIEAGTEKTGKITYRLILVDITYLCESICDCALWYYKNNADKFQFHFDVTTQEQFMNPSPEALMFAQGDIYAKILNQKLEKEGSAKALHPSQTAGMIETQVEKVIEEKSQPKKKKTSAKTVSKEKREVQVRSFFGRHFKEKIYVEKKEEIIQAVLKSKTKLQVNNALMRHFTSKEVSTIYQRLGPLIKDLPGR